MSQTSGPAAGLALLEAGDIAGVAAYPYVHLVRGTLLRELGRMNDAREALLLAQQHARNAEERAQLGQKISELERAQSPAGELQSASDSSPDQKCRGEASLR